MRSVAEEALARARAEWEAKKAEAAAAPKPMKLKDYERKRLLEAGPEAFGVDDDAVGRAAVPAATATYQEEQEELRAMFRRTNGTNDDDDDADDLFEPRTKSDAELVAEEDDFRSFLSDQKAAVRVQRRPEGARAGRWRLLDVPDLLEATGEGWRVRPGRQAQGRRARHAPPLLDRPKPGSQGGLLARVRGRARA